jgi:hypothetical protein
MRPFLNGFAHELLKIAAFPQQAGGEQAYDGGIAKAMEQYQGQSAKSGLKSGQPLSSAPVSRRASPTPLTTPNAMVDYASKSGGQ